MADGVKYDDASWHYDGDFPEDLPAEAGATHIGMFLTWCVLNGFAGDLLWDEFPDALLALRERRIASGEFLIKYCDEKLTDNVLNDEGNSFAEAYFGEQFIFEYEEVLASDLPTCYHVADTWENFEKIAPHIGKRIEEWRNGELETPSELSSSSEEFNEKPWWKFW